MNAQSGIANRAIAFAAHRTLEQLETRMLLSGAGSLDAAFGASGLVVDPLGATSQFEKVIPLAGNKVLAAGSTGSAGHRNFVLVRFNSNGKIDTTFGKSGKVVTDFGGDDFVSDVELAPGNKIVLLGRGGSHGDLAVARYGLDGKLDTTFSGDGKLLIGKPGPVVSEDALGVDFAGRIKILSGDLIALKPDGTPDSSFAPKGRLTHAQLAVRTGLTGSIDALAVTSTGVTILGGSFQTDLQLFTSDTSALNSKGQTVNAGFHDGTGEDDTRISRIQRLNDGSMLFWTHLAGITHESVDWFGAEGKFISEIRYLDEFKTDEDPNLNFIQFAQQSDGKLIAAGWVGNFITDNTTDDVFVARYQKDGKLDFTFGNNGYVVTNIGRHLDKAFGEEYGTSEFPSSIAIDSSGRIVVAGRTQPFNSSTRPFLARYLASPASSGFASIDSEGTLNITSTAISDFITVDYTSSDHKTIRVKLNDHAKNFDASKVKAIHIDSGDGDDEIHVNVKSNATILCGAGQDYVVTGAGNSTIFGGPGSDLFEPGSGNDVVHGGPGSDSFASFTRDGADTFFGDSGSDVASFIFRKDDLTISLDNQANDGAAGEHDNIESDVESVLSGSGNDRLIGNSLPNRLDGGAGNDTIYGGDGNDVLFGDAGHDHLFGQGGNDFLSAADGEVDSLDGGAGTDTASRDNSATVKDVTMNIEAFT